VSLLEEAQKQGYSMDGEIFNIHHMVPLANYCGLMKIHVQSNPTVPLSYRDIWNILKEGGTVIIPYDSQPFTKLPILSQGKNAHYGIIVGMLLGYHHQPLCGCPNHAVQHNDNHMNTDTSTTIPSLTEITSSDIISDNAAHTLVLVQHGLSRKLTIAPWDDFVTSNGQLNTIDITKCCHLPADTKMNLSNSIIVCYG
jgi:hypothetical protein